jgi:Ribonuclease G/E
MQQEVKKPVHQDKVVFIIDTNRNQEEKSIYPQSYEYVEAVLNSVLRKNNISTEKLFIGGKKENIVRFLSTLIENYNYDDLLMVDDTGMYKDDADFE